MCVTSAPCIEQGPPQDQNHQISRRATIKLRTGAPAPARSRPKEQLTNPPRGRPGTPTQINTDRYNTDGYRPQRSTHASKYVFNPLTADAPLTKNIHYKVYSSPSVHAHLSVATTTHTDRLSSYGLLIIETRALAPSKHYRNVY